MLENDAFDACSKASRFDGAVQETESTMRLFATVAAAAGILGLASAAQALPMAPTEAPSAITTVAGGCGPGWHPTRWGRCVPNRRMYRRAPPPRAWHGHRHHRHWNRHHRHHRR